VVVWDGLGLGAGGVGGGLGVGVLDEGVGVGRAVRLVRGDGAAVGEVLLVAFLCACLLDLPSDGVALVRAAALAWKPGLGPGDGFVAWAAVVAAA